MSNNFDEIVRIQSEKKKADTRDKRREKLQGIAEGASSAPPSGQLISCVVPREKQVSGDPL